MLPRLRASSISHPQKHLTLADSLILSTWWRWYMTSFLAWSLFTDWKISFQNDLIGQWFSEFGLGTPWRSLETPSGRHWGHSCDNSIKCYLPFGGSFFRRRAGAIQSYLDVVLPQTIWSSSCLLLSPTNIKEIHTNVKQCCSSICPGKTYYLPIF